MPNPEDALRDLAAASASGDEPIELPDAEPAGTGRPDSPIAGPPRRPDAPPAVERDASEMSANALAQLSGSESAAYDPAAQSASRRKRRMHKPDVGMMQFRAAAIPVLITVGLVMTVLGVWGVLVMAGNTTLPKANEPDAQKYAVLALVGGMVGILLFAGAGFFLYQYLQDKKKLEAYEETKAAQRRG